MVAGVVLSRLVRRVLNAMRVVLVEHMDEVLREALLLHDPDAIFGANRVRPLEYRNGKLLGPDDDAPPRTGILSLDGDLGDAVDYTGDGNLGYPAPIGGGLAFADATSGAVEIDLVGAGGAPAGRASFASSMPSWPRLTAGDGVLYVAVSDAVVAFAAP